MQGLSSEHTGDDPAREVYLEFSFFDGVMVDSRDIDRSEDRPWDSLSTFCNKPGNAAAANEIPGITDRNDGKEASCSSGWEGRPKQGSLLEKSISPNRNGNCTSALGIHMCNCEDDSLDCNLATCIMSPLGGRSVKTRDMFQGKMAVNSKDCNEKGSRILLCSPGRKQDNLHDQRGEALSSGKEGYRHDWKDPGKESGGKSALAAWAAVISDSPSCSSMLMTGFAESVSPKKGARVVNHRERLPTLASHLVLTGTAVAQCKIHNDCKGIDVDSAVPITPLHFTSPRRKNTLKRDFAGLKLDPGNLSIIEPAPYGTIHGLLYYTLREGLPNYTFLLDDYEEVVTAKIWTEDMVLGNEQGAWRYSFYSLRGENKKKGKAGWKHWRRKERLASTLVGKMKVSSVLCSDERNLSVESECILFSARAQEPATMARGDISSQISASLLETVPLGCSNAACTLDSILSETSHSLTASSDGHLNLSSPGATPSSLWYGSQSVSPSRQKSHKWSLRSGIPGIRITKTRNKSNHPQLFSLIPTSSSTHPKEFLTDYLAWSNNQIESELAAMVINVPLEMQDRRMSVHEQHRQANITVILPSGNHGRPLCELRGPSPLIKRWKEGGKCDCKGWDLGCGLMVLSNLRQNAEKTRETEALKLQKDSGEGKTLTLYKQDTDPEDAFLSLAPHENGLAALDFRAPLSPLQAFAIAVAILHGRESSIPEIAPPAMSQICTKNADGSCAGIWKSKEEVQEKRNHDRLNCSSELALSFERV